MEYPIIIEEGPNNFGAYPPDLPGVGVTGATREEVIHLVREAIEFHIEGLREAGLPVPQPSSFATVEVAA